MSIIRMFATLLLMSFIGVVITGCGGVDPFSRAHASAVSGPSSAPLPPSAEPKLISIAVGPPDASVVVGSRVQFTATGLFGDGSRKDLTSQVTWSSANSSVASINNTAELKGLALPVRPGSTQITAELAGVSGSTTLTAAMATVLSIGVTPASPKLAKGTQQSLTATGLYSDGSKHDITTLVTWSSAAASVASVSFNGRATALNPGSTIVSASLETVSGSTTLIVTPAALVSLDVTPANSKLTQGTVQSLVATGVYSDGSTLDVTNSVVWSSSDSTVALVSNSSGVNGRATALSAGSVKVAASLEGVSGSTTLTVTAASLVSIAVSPSNGSVAKGLTTNFKATGTYSDHSTQDLTTAVIWSTSDATVAAVSNAAGYEGLATTLSPGSTTITAAIGAVSGSTTLTVTVGTLVSIGVTPAGPTIVNGTSKQFTATGVYTDGSTQDLTAAVTWGSSNTSVASISNASGSSGLATSAGGGSTNVSAALGSVSGSTTLTVTTATLVSIGVTPANPAIAKGTGKQFTATGTYTDSSTQDLTAAVTWASSNTSVASISNATGSNGLATSAAVGATTVSATLGSVSGSTTLTVTAATLVSIGVTPANPSIAKGTSEQFTATGVYTDGSTQDLTGTVTWASSNPSAASISNASGSNGLATSAAIGSTTVSATLASVSGSTTLTVTAATLVSIGVTPANPTIAKGTGKQFTATGTYTDSSTQDLTATVTWGSSNTSVASISNASGSQGLATSAAVGSTTVSATLGSVSGSTTLTVTAATLVSIGVTPASPTIAKGTGKQFTATGVYTDGSTQDLTATVTWASSNTSAASISNASGSRGLATSVNSGSTTISATIGSVSGSTTLTVAPATLVSLSITPASPTIANGTSQKFTATGTYSDSSTANLTAVATWTSSDTSIAGISNAAGSNGLASAVAIGSTRISASLSGVVSPEVVLTVTGSSAYAYAANQSDSTVSQYTIGATGALIHLGDVPTGNGPSAVTIDPSGRYAYVTNQNENTISQYTIGSDGRLTSIGAALDTGNLPISDAVDPSGRYVYVVNNVDGTISEYSIGVGGALTAIGTVATEIAPYFISIDPTGRYVYVVNSQDDSISQYTIGADGALAPMPVSTVPTVHYPTAIVVEPMGRFVYVTEFLADKISQYAIGTSGQLTPMGAVSGVTAPIALVTDPAGRYLYAANYYANSVTQYAIGADGVLSPNGTVATGVNPYSLTVEPSGHYVYVVNQFGNSVSEYTIGAGGALTALSPIGTVATGNYPMSIATGY